MADGFTVIGLPRDVDGDARGAAACLADEIAIDFPAFGAIRDRMRRAFLATDRTAASHVAEIRLTPRQAFRGADVPLDVPLSTTCGSCGGRGEVWMDPCCTCAGTGAAIARYAVRVTLPAGVRDGARFRFRVGTPSAAPTAVEVRVAIR